MVRELYLWIISYIKQRPDSYPITINIYTDFLSDANSIAMSLINDGKLNVTIDINPIVAAIKI